MKKIALLFFLISILFNLSSAEKVKDIHYFIGKAWEHDSQIKQEKFNIKKYKNLKLEAISTYTPKVNGITWIAPIYSQHGDHNHTRMDLTQWGPYYHLDLMFQQPLFAFTRVISGIKAAAAGENVAKADVELKKWEVAKNIRLYYYGIVFGHTMLKTIKMADEMLANAIKMVELALKKADGSVSEVELNKLKFFYTQIPVYRSFAQKSVDQAQQALFLSTGEKLQAKDIPGRLVLEIEQLEDKSYYLDLMLKNRPLLKKLNYGIQAKRQLMLLEFKSMIPVLFAGGFLRYNVAPSFPIPTSVLQRNDFNTFNGRPEAGAAFGLLWQFDPMKSITRGLQKKAEYDQLLELKNYAMQGFPVQLGKVIDDLKDIKVKVDNQKIAITHAQNWMFFAANAYALGNGEAKDIMEGLAAYIQSKLGYYQAIYDYNKLLGEFCQIVGVNISKKTNPGKE